MTARGVTPRQGSDGGFTLLELLVGLVVVGLILAALGQALHFGLSGWRVQARVLAGSARIEPIDRALRRLITHLDPNGAPNDAPLTGDTSSLAFASRLPDSLAAGKPARAGMRLAMTGQGALVLSWQSAPIATRLAAIPTTSRVLVSGLSRVEFAYYGADGAGWRGTWRDGRPPALVRIRLVFPPGDTNHWPDIVEAPRMAAGPQ